VGLGPGTDRIRVRGEDQTARLTRIRTVVPVGEDPERHLQPDAGPGTYRFKGRLRNTVNGATSGFSPVLSVRF
jgi:hypothetical protein